MIEWNITKGQVWQLYKEFFIVSNVKEKRIFLKRCNCGDEIIEWDLDKLMTQDIFFVGIGDYYDR